MGKRYQPSRRDNGALGVLKSAASARGHYNRTAAAAVGGGVGAAAGSFLGPVGALIGGGLGAFIGANVGNVADFFE